MAFLWSGRYDASGIILYLRRSRNLYQQAFELNPESIYSGINAAVKSLFLGEEDVANQIAEKAIIQLKQHKSYPDPYRSLIVAEAHLMKRNLEDARQLYQKMVDDYFDKYKGQLFSTYKQVMKICKALQMSEDEIRYILHPFQLLKDLK